MVFEIKNPELFKKSDDKDQGQDILVSTNEELKLKGAVEDEVDPKDTVSFYDNEDLRLYNVFQDTPSIVTSYINKKNKNLSPSLTYTSLKDKASKADLERFEALVESQSPVSLVPSRAVNVSQILEDKDKKRNAMVYPNLNVDLQNKDNTNYDLFYRKRPLDTVNMPWYKKRALSFAEGVTTGGLGLVELATIPIDYAFETDYLSEVQKLTEKVDIKSNSFLDQFFAELDGKVCSSMNVLTQLLRLHQITCGHFKADDGTIKHLKNNRLDELMSLLDETEGKVIIWANYVEDIKNIVKSLKKAYGEASTVEYHGGVKQSARQRQIALFQEKNGLARYFVGNPQTGGYGITLTAANTVVYYSNNYDLEKRLQSEDRAHRIGQVNKVTYVDLICEKTVDEKIVKALRNKVNIANEILGEELKQWL